MKKIITNTLLIVALTLISGVAISATNKASIQKSERETARREIINNIACPDFIEANDPINQVKAIVSIDETGNVSVEQINSGNPKLQAYVIDRLQNMKLKHQGISQKFVLVINFQVD